MPEAEWSETAQRWVNRANGVAARACCPDLRRQGEKEDEREKERKMGKCAGGATHL